MKVRVPLKPVYMQKGKLPETGFITFDTTKDDWLNFSNDDGNSVLTTTGIINGKYKVKVEIQSVQVDIIIKALPNPVAEKIRTEGKTTPLMCVKDFFDQELTRSVWILSGYIVGPTTRVPILIAYIVLVDKLIFTQQLAVESVNDFFNILRINPN